MTQEDIVEGLLYLFGFLIVALPIVAGAVLFYFLLRGPKRRRRDY